MDPSLAPQILPSQTPPKSIAAARVLPLVECTCCRLAQHWSSLKPIGIQPDWDDDGNYSPLELANCACGSTLARKVQS